MEEQFDTTLPTEDVSSSKFDGSLQIISDNSLILVQRVAAFLVSLFAVLGGFTNTINIVVFWMLGFSYVSNISLFALSVSDLVILFFLEAQAICHNHFHPLETIWSCPDFVKLIFPVSYSCLAISSWITAVISVERCCCILFPLKVGSDSLVGSSEILLIKTFVKKKKKK